MTGTRSIIVHPAAAVARRELGAQAWSALEVLLAAAHDVSPTTAVMSVRSLALELGVSKNAAARALGVLRTAGMIEPRQARASNGVFDAGSYSLTIPADFIDVAESTTRTESTAIEPSLPPTRNGARRREAAPAQLSLLDAG